MKFKWFAATDKFIVCVNYFLISYWVISSLCYALQKDFKMIVFSLAMMTINFLTITLIEARYKMKTFEIGEKVYIEWEKNTFFGVSTYKGVATIFAREKDSNSQTVYYLTKNSNEVMKVMKNIYNVDDNKVKALEALGCFGLVYENQMMPIPQQSEYTIKEMQEFGKKYNG